jgi:hypothetical protein
MRPFMVKKIPENSKTCLLSVSSLRLFTKDGDDRMQVESALAGAARGFQNRIRPDGPALKRLLVVQQDQLNETRQGNIHFVTGRDVTVIAGMAYIHILPGGFPDNASQGHA